MRQNLIKRFNAHLIIGTAAGENLAYTFASRIVWVCAVSVAYLHSVFYFLVR